MVKKNKVQSHTEMLDDLRHDGTLQNSPSKMTVQSLQDWSTYQDGVESTCLSSRDDDETRDGNEDDIIACPIRGDICDADSTADAAFGSVCTSTDGEDTSAVLHAPRRRQYDDDSVGATTISERSVETTISTDSLLDESIVPKLLMRTRQKRQVQRHVQSRMRSAQHPVPSPRTFDSAWSTVGSFDTEDSRSLASITTANESLPGASHWDNETTLLESRNPASSFNNVVRTEKKEPLLQRLRKQKQENSSGLPPRFPVKSMSSRMQQRDSKRQLPPNASEAREAAMLEKDLEAITMPPVPVKTSKRFGFGLFGRRSALPLKTSVTERKNKVNIDGSTARNSADTPKHKKDKVPVAESTEDKIATLVILPSTPRIDNRTPVVTAPISDSDAADNSSDGPAITNLTSAAHNSNVFHSVQSSLNRRNVGTNMRRLRKEDAPAAPVQNTFPPLNGGLVKVASLPNRMTEDEATVAVQEGRVSPSRSDSSLDDSPTQNESVDNIFSEVKEFLGLTSLEGASKAEDEMSYLARQMSESQAPTEASFFRNLAHEDPNEEFEVVLDDDATRAANKAGAEASIVWRQQGQPLDAASPVIHEKVPPPVIKTKSRGKKWFKKISISRLLSMNKGKKRAMVGNLQPIEEDGDKPTVTLLTVKERESEQKINGIGHKISHDAISEHSQSASSVGDYNGSGDESSLFLSYSMVSHGDTTIESSIDGSQRDTRSKMAKTDQSSMRAMKTISVASSSDDNSTLDSDTKAPSRMSITRSPVRHRPIESSPTGIELEEAPELPSNVSTLTEGLQLKESLTEANADHENNKNNTTMKVHSKAELKTVSAWRRKFRQHTQKSQTKPDALDKNQAVKKIEAAPPAATTASTLSNHQPTKSPSNIREQNSMIASTTVDNTSTTLHARNLSLATGMTSVNDATSLASTRNESVATSVYDDEETASYITQETGGYFNWPIFSMQSKSQGKEASWMSGESFSRASARSNDSAFSSSVESAESESLNSEGTDSRM